MIRFFRNIPKNNTELFIVSNEHVTVRTSITFFNITVGVTHYPSACFRKPVFGLSSFCQVPKDQAKRDCLCSSLNNTVLLAFVNKRSDL